MIKTRFNVTLAERSVGAMLCRRVPALVGAAAPSQQDPAAQETHKNILRLSKPPSPSMRANNRLNFGGRTKPGLASRAH